MQHLKIPREFLFLLEEASGDLFVLELCSHKLPFSVCGYRFQNGWDFKGSADSFDSGVSNRGENALLAHDFTV